MTALSQSFLKNFLRDPHGTGAVAPASRKLAECVATATKFAFDRHSGPAGARRANALKIIELGAGTGSISLRLRVLNPILIERDENWAGVLRERFPGLEVRQECATGTLAGIDAPVGLVSSIPLLNNPQSGVLKQLLAARYEEGLVKFCVLYTYGWRDPLAGRGFREARRMSFVPRSLPPAHVWLYQ